MRREETFHSYFTNGSWVITIHYYQLKEKNRTVYATLTTNLSTAVAGIIIRQDSIQVSDELVQTQRLRRKRHPVTLAFPVGCETSCPRNGVRCKTKGGSSSSNLTHTSTLCVRQGVLKTFKYKFLQKI